MPNHPRRTADRSRPPRRPRHGQQRGRGARRRRASGRGQPRPATTATASACCRTMSGCCRPACWCPTRRLRAGGRRRRRAGVRRRARLRPGHGQGGHAAGHRARPRAGLRHRGLAQQRPYRPDRPLGRAVRRRRHGLGPFRQRRRPQPAAGALWLQRRAARHQPVRRRACPGPAPSRQLLLDMATSAIAFGKARVARNKGVPVPEGVLIDEHGRPTTDPTTYVDTRRRAPCSPSAPTRARAWRSCARCWARRSPAAPPSPRTTSARTASSTACCPSSSTLPRSASPARIARRDRGRGRLGQGLAAGAGLRRGPAAGRARAPRPAAPPGRGRADRRQEPGRHPGRRSPAWA